MNGRSQLLLSSLLFVASTLIYPAESSAAGQRCFKDAPHAHWRDVEIVKVGDKATKDSPIVIDYRHDPAVDGDDLHFFFKVTSSKKRSGLHIRTEWDPASLANIDLLLDDEFGERTAYSGAWNIPVLDEVWDGIYGHSPHGGTGYEYIEGAEVDRCTHYRLTSIVFYSTLAVDVRMTVWLGSAEWKP